MSDVRIGLSQTLPPGFQSYFERSLVEEPPLILEGAALFLLCSLIHVTEFLTHCPCLPSLCFTVKAWMMLKPDSP